MTSLHMTSNYQTSKKHCQGETVTPDSTTQVETLEFSKGADVLAKQRDGRYYFGTVVDVDIVRDQYLVKYGDNTQHWSSFKDLTKPSTGIEQEDLLCVICKKSSPRSEKEITVCDRCGRGYHKKCHEPEIASRKEDSSCWMCKRCIDSDPNRLKRTDAKPPFRRDSRNSAGSVTQETMPSTTTPKVLPYDLSSLNWDTYHRVNTEQVYCYCGQNGEWYKQMLQCGRCRQWFHEKCIDCLHFPLYCGDRFYVFVCAICNHGKEFVRRLEMKWVDIVHLMLFNLTLHHCRKYYDLDTVVIPYITDNWHVLQLAPKVFNVTKAERRENILSVLTNNRNRFKCGREIKKRTTIWGLRVRLPPPAPGVVLPQPHGRITEGELRELWQGNRRLQFLSPPACSNSRTIVSGDTAMAYLMLGVAYQQSASHSESESPCPSPEIVKEKMVISPSFTIKFLHGKDQYLGAGCAKKTAPFKRMSLQRRKKLLIMTTRDRERILKRPRRSFATIQEEYFQNSMMGRQATNNMCDEEVNSLEPKPIQGVEMPPTPPPSVSAPPTPPTSTGGGSMQSDFSNEFSEGSNQAKAVSIKKHNPQDLELNTLCDTSSDETSSKSTLDLIIPPPKDFEGKNNPFLGLLNIAGEDQAKKKKGKEITLPLPLKTVIPGQPIIRAMKRQLSEKDIIIGPNGEIKRKRFRRIRNNVASYGSGHIASKTATVIPARFTDSNEQFGNHMDYALNAHVRCLRQRPEKDPSIKQPTPKLSPVKTEPDIDMEDLKTSVNIYFGAANRIAAGERFSVMARRMGPTGKLECLIEWEGPGESQGMT